MDKQYFYCFKTFLVFIAVMYIPGLFYFPFFSEGYFSYYNFSGGLYQNFFILITCFLMITLICFWFLGNIPYFRIPTLNSRIIFFILVLMFFLYFFLAVYFNLNFSSSFRHNNRLSNAGPLIGLLFFIKPIIYFIVLLMLIHVLNGNKLGRYSRYLLLLTVLSTVLFLNSSLQFIIIPVIIIVLYFPRFLILGFRELNIRYILAIAIFIPLFCVLVVLVGVGNKVGFSFLFTKEGFDYLKVVGGVLFPRMSTSLFSSVIIMDKHLDGITYSLDVLNGIQGTLANRFSLLFPTDNFNSDLIHTVNRLNYIEVFKSHADRAGASPGIVSSIFYTPFFPFTFILIPLYVAHVFKAIRYHMKDSLKMNVLSMLILSYLIISLFESPLNILYVLDPIFILFVTVTFFGRLINIDKVFSK